MDDGLKLSRCAVRHGSKFYSTVGLVQERGIRGAAFLGASLASDPKAANRRDLDEGAQTGPVEASAIRQPAPSSNCCPTFAAGYGIHYTNCPEYSVPDSKTLAHAEVEVNRRLKEPR
jgi:hypothetical protein